MTFTGPRGVLSRTPLRVKLVAVLLGLTALAELITGAAASSAIRGYLLDRVDAQLVRTSGLLNEAHDQDRFSPPSGTTVELPSEFVVLILNTDGQIVDVGSTTAGATPQLELPPLTLDDALGREGLPFTVQIRDRAERWRVLVTAVPDGSGSIALARPLAEIDATVRRLSLVILVVSLAVLVLLAGLAYALVQSSLRPLVEVERTAKAIASGQLSSRVPEADPRTEVGRLTAALNGMLARIENAFAAKALSENAARASEDRMRQFVADASHELRTPLTSIRGFAELYRHGGIPPADVDRVLGRVESEATRMALLVDDLLLLARLDHDRPLEKNPVDLAAIASDAVSDVGALVSDHTVSLVVHEGAPPIVPGDAQRLRQVATNLVSNAIRHTPAGTAVTVTVGVEDDHALLDVADTGPGMPSEDAERVFERFYRVDPARSREAGGTGLGLSIVTAIVRAHGGSVDLVTAPGEGATFRVRLPLTDPQQPPAGSGTESG